MSRMLKMLQSYSVAHDFCHSKTEEIQFIIKLFLDEDNFYFQSFSEGHGDTLKRKISLFCMALVIKD